MEQQVPNLHRGVREQTETEAERIKPKADRSMTTDKVMWSLDCCYYEAEFPTIGDLIAHIMISGMDPNYEITCNGKGIGEKAVDYITF